MFLGKSVLKIYSKFTGEYSCQTAISIKLQSNFIEITFWHGCSPFKLAVYFEDTFSWKHLWRAPSVLKWEFGVTYFKLLTAQKMKFSMKYFFSKSDQIHSFLRIFYLLKSSLMENFIFCAVTGRYLNIGTFSVFRDHRKRPVAWNVLSVY